jgi:hypothetical protein
MLSLRLLVFEYLSSASTVISKHECRLMSEVGLRFTNGCHIRVCSGFTHSWQQEGAPVSSPFDICSTQNARHHHRPKIFPRCLSPAHIRTNTSCMPPHYQGCPSTIGFTTSPTASKPLWSPTSMSSPSSPSACASFRTSAILFPLKFVSA